MKVHEFGIVDTTNDIWVVREAGVVGAPDAYRGETATTGRTC